MRLLTILFLILITPLSTYKTAYGEPYTVQESLEQAFAYSPLLHSKVEAKEMRKHQVRQAKAGYFPTLSVWAGAGTEQETSPVSRNTGINDDPVALGEFGLTLQQNIWDGGVTKAQLGISEAGFETSKYYIRDTSILLALRTVTGHNDIILSRKILKLTEDNLEAHKKLVKMLENRLTQGLSNIGDYNQGLTRLHRVEATYELNKQRLQVALTTYAKITGQYAPDELAVVELPKDMYLSVEDVQNVALQRNIQLKIVSSNIESIQEEVNLAETGFVPKLNLDITPSFKSNNPQEERDVFTWGAMVNMNWDLYRGGATKAGVNAQNAKLREFRKLLLDTKDSVFETATITFEQGMTAKKQAQFFQKAVETSSVAKTSFYEQFKVGKKDVLNLLDIEAEHFSAQVEYLVATSQFKIAQYSLHAIAGTLIEELNLQNTVDSLINKVTENTEKLSTKTIKSGQ